MEVGLPKKAFSVVGALAKALSHHLDFAPRPRALTVFNPLGAQALINRVGLIFVQPFRHSITRIDPGPLLAAFCSLLPPLPPPWHFGVCPMDNQLEERRKEEIDKDYRRRKTLLYPDSRDFRLPAEEMDRAGPFNISPEGSKTRNSNCDDISLMKIF
ncbi:hypothetical protein AVEN_12716-1 [Araneus ventricosus]|uniref:Uncharacterized protein n=1 Tax=Araneus ventricosus TaxID=182803 RepID=A0A4Y2ACM6_ARAVE|nr:hypothetical protein AVEN_12716-1 [Araneus ventricosus]